MANKKLESFKAGQVQGKKPLPRRETKTDEPQSYSVGFARIESLLDKEDPAAVGATLSAIHKNLADLEDAAKSNRDKLQAQKARAGVELAIDMVEYLFHTKASLEGKSA